MSEKEIKIENEISETQISEITNPVKGESKEENQNNKDFKSREEKIRSRENDLINKKNINRSFLFISIGF